MSLYFICSISPDATKAILFFVLAAVILAAPLIYRILSGEKFGWFRNPRYKRPNEKQWQEFRAKADLIIADKLKIEARDLYGLLRMAVEEIEYYKRNKKKPEFATDRERIAKLSKILTEMVTRIEPFDSLIENLRTEGLIKQSEQLGALRRNPSATRKQFLTELKKIKAEHWHALSKDAKSILTESIKCLKRDPFVRLYISMGAFVLILGMAFYNSIVEQKGYKVFKDNPVLLVIIAAIIIVPSLILTIKLLARKK